MEEQHLCSSLASHSYGGQPPERSFRPRMVPLCLESKNLRADFPSEDSINGASYVSHKTLSSPSECIRTSPRSAVRPSDSRRPAREREREFAVAGQHRTGALSWAAASRQVSSFVVHRKVAAQSTDADGRATVCVSTSILRNLILESNVEPWTSLRQIFLFTEL